MKIIAREQCSGKTKELISIAIENNIPILCFSESQKKSILEKSLVYFNSVAPTCSLNDIIDYSIESVLIDNLDKAISYFIKDLSGYDTTVVGATLTI